MKLLTSLLAILIFGSGIANAEENIKLSLKNVPVREALVTLAKFLNKNVLLSHDIEGQVSLELEEGNAREIFDFILIKYNLSVVKKASAWFIVSRSHLQQWEEQERAWQTHRLNERSLASAFWQIKFAKAEQLVQLLREEKSGFLSARGRVYFDSRTNLIYVHDVPEKLQLIRALIKRLDIPIQQILIEARLVSIDHDFERELGVQFAMRTGDKKENFEKKISNKYSLVMAKLADGSLLDVKLSALEKAGHAELISSPSLSTENQQTASIEAGEEVPYQEVSESGGTAVTFKKAVLRLKVTPQILPGGRVLLQLQINQDRPTSRLVLGVPSISTRQLITKILIKSGQTVVLGGIFETNAENTQQGVPFFCKLPLLGFLFSQHEQRRVKRELLIFVTPRIINTYEDRQN